MLDAAAAGAAAGLAIAVPVGPVAILIVDTGVRHGLRGALADVLAPVAGAIRVASVAVLVAVALVLIAGALRRAPERAQAPPPAAHRTTARFLALTIANPPTAAYFASLVLGLPAVAHGAAADRAAFALAALAASLAWQCAVACLGAFLGHGLPGGARRVTGVLGGTLVLVLALHVALG